MRSSSKYDYRSLLNFFVFVISIINEDKKT